LAEAYGNARVLENGVEVSRPPPVPELEGFQGTRIMSCATGEFLALNRQGLNDVVTAMTATEFLRDKVRAGEPVAFSELRQAAEALYGPVLVLRETGQTCACEAYFDELRPAGQTPYEERTDVER
jgi:hypothetical protein